MGGRMLKRWIAMPLVDIERITRRQEIVQRLVDDAELADAIREHVSLIGDLSNA